MYVWMDVAVVILVVSRQAGSRPSRYWSETAILGSYTKGSYILGGFEGFIRPVEFFDLPRPVAIFCSFLHFCLDSFGFAPDAPQFHATVKKLVCVDSTTSGKCY